MSAEAVLAYLWYAYIINIWILFFIFFFLGIDLLIRAYRR